MARRLAKDMFSPLTILTYLCLFAAQVLSMLGTGLATVALGLVAAMVLWPRPDVEEIEHLHARLPPRHAHLGDARPDPTGSIRHSHAFVIDELHRRWPR